MCSAQTIWKSRSDEPAGSLQDDPDVFYRFPGKCERFNPFYVPKHARNKAKRYNQAIFMDESKMCPFTTLYDGYIHDALANMRRQDGSIPAHVKNDTSVIFFAPPGTCKY